MSEHTLSVNFDIKLNEEQRKIFDDFLLRNDLVTITTEFNGEKHEYENCSIEYWWNEKTYLIKWKQEIEDGSNGEFILNRKKMDEILNENAKTGAMP